MVGLVGTSLLLKPESRMPDPTTNQVRMAKFSDLTIEHACQAGVDAARKTPGSVEL